MNNKKVLIISILSMFTVLILIIGLTFFSINKRERTLTENIDIIKSNYAKFSNNTSESETIKADLTNLIEKFNNQTYAEVHGEYEKVLKRYDKNIKYIEEIVKDMEERCQYKYEDTVITLLCKGYDILYEETINIYISNVNKYNDKLSKYNETADIKYDLHKPLYTKYIDYDKDGEYEGK